MKKITIVSALLMIFCTPASACDICGGGAGSSYLGLMPAFGKKFLGIRYQHNSLLHHLGPGGTSNYLTTRESYHIAELWGVSNIGTRFSVTGFVPFNFIERSNQQERVNASGPGDITLLAYYKILKRGAEEHDWKQDCWLGGGMKLPTGKYDPEDKNVQQGSQNTFQLGTGSTDFSVNAMYDLQYRNTGININAGYRMNTRNRYDYRYGNKFTANALLYHRINISDQVMLRPNTGCLLEAAAKDHETKDIQVWETGGQALMGTVGLEISAGRFSAGANFQTPLMQHLGEGKLKAQDRVMIHLGISI